MRHCIWFPCLYGSVRRRSYLDAYKLVGRGVGRGVSIVTSLGAGRPEVRIPTGMCTCRCAHRLWARRSRLFSGYRGSFLRVKRPGRDVNHSSPPSAVFRDEWSHALAPPAYLHGVDGDIFLFYVSWFVAVDVWLCVVFVRTFGSHVQFIAVDVWLCVVFV